jgi:hypothetical protein
MSQNTLASASSSVSFARRSPRTFTAYRRRGRLIPHRAQVSYRVTAPSVGLSRRRYRGRDRREIDAAADVGGWSSQSVMNDTEAARSPLAGGGLHAVETPERGPRLTLLAIEGPRA